MKSITLSYPCSWEKRVPSFEKRLIYIPEYYENHQDFSSKEYNHYLFQKQTLVVEFCSGNGQWIIEQAKKFPNTNFIAVEKRFDRAKKIWKKIHSEKLENLIVVLGDGRTFSKFYLPKSVVDTIYINFPDPWPKKRHKKHRIINTDFLHCIKENLKEKGSIYISTDHASYLEDTKELFLKDKEWKTPFPPPYHVTDLEGYGTSFFDTLFREKNETIYYLNFIKNVC